ncbi:MAG TPA: hypothetical protein VEZ55_09520, partial [Chitinophagaceae bacterium]|nr:hypothetical protein [Chitinophagaceae bacterium]
PNTIGCFVGASYPLAQNSCPSQLCTICILKLAASCTTWVITVYCKSPEKIVDGLKEWGDHHRALIFKRSPD